MKEKTTFPRYIFSFLSILLITASAFHSIAQGTWTPLASLPPNLNYGVMLLLTDGSVLVKTDTDSHGFGCLCLANPGDTWNRLTPDSHGSYVNGTWTTIAPMGDTRMYFASQVLQDGRVYVAGGEYGTGISTAEVYNPLTDVWTPASFAGGATDTILDGNSQLLPDGRILQALAFNPDNRTIIYDPATNVFSPGPNVLGTHSESAWLLLKDNSILFGDRITHTSERYIPATGTWVSDAGTPAPLYDWAVYETGSAQLLPDGRGVFFGGSGNVLYYTPTGTAAPGTWSAGQHMPPGMGVPDAPSTMMVNGKILCALSDTNTAAVLFPSPTYFYEFDYIAGTWTPVNAPVGGDTLSGPCGNTNMLTLPDGNVLFSYYGSQQYYIYTPGGTPLAAGKPTVDTVIKISCTEYMATGKLFNGISQGANYGDDWQMATNYPIVRLTSGTNVYYARSYNWNSTGVMRGTAADTTYFDLPSGLPEDSYSLQVVANGNPSAGRAFNTCGFLDLPIAAKGRESISMLPNPASDEVTLVFESVVPGAYTISIADIAGRTRLSETGKATTGSNSHTIHLDGLSKGLYTATLRTADGAHHEKLVVE